MRGFRIELGEIEAVVLDHASVSQAAVLVREDTPGDKRLVAYIVATDRDDSQPPTDLPSWVKASAAERLPEYMVPSAVVVLDALPLTVNGKLDRKALPAPDYTASPADGRAPATVVEEILCSVFAEVLGLDRVGVEDNFFELGGHSLLAVSLVERLRARGVSVSVRALFASPTPAGIAAVAGVPEVVVPPNRIPADAAAITPDMVTLVDLSEAELDLIVAKVPGGAPNVADIYPLAPLQEGMVFHHMMTGGENGGGDVYLQPTVLGFDTRDQADEMLAALQKVVDRHDIYRTAVVWEGLSEPVQVVNRRAQVPVSEVLLAEDAENAESAGNAADRSGIEAGSDTEAHSDTEVHSDTEMAARLLAAAGSRMDLQRAPLIRAFVAELPGTGKWQVLVQMHHLLQDHTSRVVFLEEIAAVLRGDDAALTEPLPFRAFVAHARLGISREEHGRFFAGLLGDVTETTAPFGLLDVHGDGSDVEHARVPLDAPLAARIREQARRSGVSAATLFHVAWARALASVSGREDVVFGTVLFGRMNAGTGADRVPGPFLNTLPVRVRTDHGSVEAAVSGMQSQLADLLVHEHAPLAVAQQASGVVAPAPLFTSIFNYRHSRDFGQRRADRSDGVPDGAHTVYSHDRTNYPLTVAVDDVETGFTAVVDAVAPVDADRVCRLLLTAVEGIVTALQDESGIELTDVPVLGEVERSQVLGEWSVPAVDASPVTMPELFAAQVAARPDAVAVESEDAAVTYGELDARAGRLARRLVGLGVGPESVVGVCMPRGVETIVALLAVLKAGGAYLPLDPQYPADRLAYTVQDAKAVCVVTVSELTDSVPSGDVPLLLLDVADESEAEDTPETLLAPGLLPSHPAYVIYTSGSTGRPKGVMVDHACAVGLFAASQGLFEFGADDVWSWFHSF
ncbi:aryl carrier-like protein, partial [Catenulispora sp. MAP5-51]